MEKTNDLDVDIDGDEASGASGESLNRLDFIIFNHLSLNKYYNFKLFK